MIEKDRFGLASVTDEKFVLEQMYKAKSDYSWEHYYSVVDQAKEVGLINYYAWEALSENKDSIVFFSLMFDKDYRDLDSARAIVSALVSQDMKFIDKYNDPEMYEPEEIVSNLAFA